MACGGSRIGELRRLSPGRQPFRELPSGPRLRLWGLSALGVQGLGVLGLG